MKISEKKAIVQNISIIDSYQSVEFVPVVETMGRNAASRGMFSSVALGLLMAFMPGPATASIYSHESQRCQEELILQCVRTAPVVQNIIKSRLLERLENMRTLEEGWVPGGLPIVPAAIDFSKRLIAHCSDAELEHWNIGPYVNGTVMMHYRGEGKRSSINIGKSTVSAFKKVGASYEAFQKPAAECFAEVLGIIHSLNS